MTEAPSNFALLRGRENSGVGRKWPEDGREV